MLPSIVRAHYSKAQTVFASLTITLCRKTCMIQKHHVAVLSANHVSVFYMGLVTNTQSHAKCTYMIDKEYNHMMLPDYTSISLTLCALFFLRV